MLHVPETSTSKIDLDHLATTSQEDAAAQRQTVLHPGNPAVASWVLGLASDRVQAAGISTDASAQPFKSTGSSLGKISSWMRPEKMHSDCPYHPLSEEQRQAL